MFNVTDMVVRAFAYCRLPVSLILRRLKSYRPLELFFAVLLLAAILSFALHALVLLYDGRYSVTRQDYWRIYRLDLRLSFPLNVLYKHK